MPQYLLNGFRIGSWKVEPPRGEIVGPDGRQRHLEPKVMDVLVCLADHAGELVPRDQLLDTVWGTASASDETLTRAIGELRRNLDDDSREPGYIETVPKRGYRLVAEVHLPLASEAWTPNSDNGIGDIRNDNGIPRLVGFAAIAIIAIGLMVFLGPRSAVDPLPGISEAPESSIAVLPFRNLGGDTTDDYFVDGIHDDIVTQLAKLSLLDRVISRTSMERYRGTKKSVAEIGQELGVANVLDGGIQRDGDVVRVNVQLIDASTQELLWAESFVRDLTTANLFAIQGEITASIANSLQVVMTTDEEEQLAIYPTEDLDAYDQYLAGKQAMARRTVDKLQQAREHFEQAIAMDPGFALAFAGLADSINLLIVYGGLSEAEFERVEFAANRAIQLNGSLGEAYAALGFVEWRRNRVTNGNYKLADRYFREAQRLAPGYAPGYQWFALAMLNSNRTAQAARMMRRAISLDPLDPNLHSDLGTIQSKNGNREAALDSFHRALEIDPAWAPAMVELGYYYMTYGEPVASIRWLREALAADPLEIRATGRLITGYLMLGNQVEAEYWYRRLQNMPRTFWQRYFEILIPISRGEHSVALDAAVKLLEDRPTCRLCVEVMAYELTRDGRPGEALALFQKLFPDVISEPESLIEMRKIHLVSPLAYALMGMGQSQEAERILAGGLVAAARLPRVVHGDRGLGLADVRMHLLLGERVEAVAAFRRAIDAGWMFSEPHFPYLLELFGDYPEYHELLSELEATQIEKQRQLSILENNGDIPPVPPFRGVTRRNLSGSDLR